MLGVHKRLGRSNMRMTIIYAHVLKGGAGAVRSPVDGL
jgi:hypothetical protein